MLKHNHVYALNYDLESLEQQLNDEGDKTRACASENFYIKKESDEDDEQCKMVSSVEYLLTIVITSTIISNRLPFSLALQSGRAS